MNFYKLMIIIILFSLVFIPGYQLQAEQDTDENWEEDFEEDFEDDFEDEDDPLPPVDMSIWPDLQYVLEVDSSMLGEGTVSRQYFGDRRVRLETIAGEEIYFVIYHFNEDGAVEFSFLENEGEKVYIATPLSYQELLDRYDHFSSLFYKILPGEELAPPGFAEEGKQDFLGRQVENWSFTDNSEGDSDKINLLIDRELRQTLKMLEPLL